MLCAVCSKPSTKTCARCHFAPYCSVEHQRQDWHNRHKHLCIDYPFAPDASNVSKMMFAWYKKINEAPHATLDEKRTVALEWMTMLRIATTFEALPHSNTIQNAIALQLISAQLKIGMNPKILERMLANVESDRDASHKHAIAQIKQDMKHANEIGNFRGLRVPFSKHARSHSNLREAARYFAHESLQIVVDEKMNGLDVVADRCFKKGDIVLVEPSFVAASLDMFGMCYHCCTLFVKNPTQCRNKCGMQYCNDECEVRAFLRYHAPLCSHAGVSQLHRILIATANEDSNAIGALHYSILLLKFCGMQMASSKSPIWEQEPLRYFHCCENENMVEHLKLRYTMLPNFIFMHVMFAMAQEDENFECPKIIDVPWFLRMTQYLWPNIFGGGYDKLTIPLDIQGMGSTIRFANMATLFNHSCMPNIDFNPNGRHVSDFSYVALRDIAKGESLRISYLESPTKHALRDKYNFDCDCDRCNAN